MEIINLEEGREVHYPLCFLRIIGIPEGATHCQIRNMSDPNGSRFDYECSSYCNAFILLIEGVNELVIECKGETLTRCIAYRPSSNKKFVRLIYVTCLNEERFQGPPDMKTDCNEAIKKIQVGALLLQTFLAEALGMEGLGFKTFKLELCTKNLPKVFVVQLPFTLAECHKLSNDKLWECIALHILSSHLGSKDCKYLAFFCGTRYSNVYNLPVSQESQIVSMTKGHVSLGGGGLALVGTGALYSWSSDVFGIMKSLKSTEEVDRSFLMDFSAGRGTWGATYGTHLGSVLHELGHTFDLGHTPHGIMGRGFEDLHIYFTSSLSYFTGRPKISHSLLQANDSVVFDPNFVQKKVVGKISMSVQPSKQSFSTRMYNLKKHLKHEKKPSTHSESKYASSVLEVNSPPSPTPSRVFKFGRSSHYHSNGIKDTGPFHLPSKDSFEHLTSASGQNHKTKGLLYKEDHKTSACRAFWSRPNAVLLAYHSWINEKSDSESTLCLKGSVMCSSAGIRLIELRDLQMNAFHHWDYTDGSPPSIIHVPWAQVPDWPLDSHIEVIAVNDDGTLLKGCCIPKPL